MNLCGRVKQDSSERRLAPLRGHGFCYFGIGQAAKLPAVRRRRKPVQSLYACLWLRQGEQIVAAMGRLKQRQTPEPEASCFRFAMTEHPRLNDLIWLPELTGHNPNGVFNRNLGYRAVPKSHEEGYCGLSLLRSVRELVAKFRFHPFISRDRQEGTGRMKAGEVPTVVENIEHIALDVPAAFVALH